MHEFQKFILRYKILWILNPAGMRLASLYYTQSQFPDTVPSPESQNLRWGNPCAKHWLDPLAVDVDTTTTKAKVKFEIYIQGP